MLDFFLVLGQIPGTDIQITFSEFLLAVSIIAPLVLWYDVDHAKKLRADVIQFSSFHSFSYPLDASQEGLLIRRKALSPRLSASWQSLSQLWRTVRQGVLDN